MSRYSNTRAERQELDALEGAAQLDRALKIMHHSHDLDLTRHAINILGRAESIALRDELVKKYDWCDARRDGGAYIRSAILRAIRPIAQPADVPLLLRAMLTYEMDGPFEVCGDLRAAALWMMNDIDPDIAASMSARFIHDPQITFSGEPANTAIKLLASHGNLAPIYGAVSWRSLRAESLAEGLRNLVDLRQELLPLLVDQYLDSEDEQVILGLFDLLLGHATRDTWAETIDRWFRTTTMIDLYGIVAIQIVGSRSEALITMLRNLRDDEVDRMRVGLLDQALELA